MEKGKGEGGEEVGRGVLDLPLKYMVTLGSPSFSVSGHTVSNALPDYVRNPTLSIDVFKRYLKTFSFAEY